MVLPGHLAGGYFVTKIVLSLTHATAVLSSAEINALFVIGILAGEIPDIDLIAYYFNQRSSRTEKIAEHRDYPTHKPALWLILSLIVVGLGLAAGSAFTEIIGWLILGGTWSHFVFDSIEHGIRWLWPFSNKRFALLYPADPNINLPKGTFRYYWAYVTGAYFKRVTFYAEIMAVVVAIALILIELR